MAAAALNIATTLMGKALGHYYGAKQPEAFFRDHIDNLKTSSNPMIERTGRVLEAVKIGFGLGYLAPVVVIAAGQIILGNPLAAVAQVATAATLTNPVAMTCAAIGAIYYGYHALSDAEKEQLVDRIAQGFALGVEVVRSIIRFCTQTLKQLFSEDNLKEVKAYVRRHAEAFGNTLGHITRSAADLTADRLRAARRVFARAAGMVRQRGGRDIHVHGLPGGTPPFNPRKRRSWFGRKAPDGGAGDPS